MGLLYLTFTWVYGYLYVVSVVCCQIEGSATGRSLVQRSPTECGVSECDLETSTMRHKPTRGLSSYKKNFHLRFSHLSIW